LTIQERNIEAIGFSIAEAARMAGVGRSTIYEQLAVGHLRGRKLGRRTIITHTDLQVWLASLPAMTSKAAGAPRVNPAQD
jgi:excisionase family DNA binding protein